MAVIALGVMDLFVHFSLFMFSVSVMYIVLLWLWVAGVSCLLWLVF